MTTVEILKAARKRVATSFIAQFNDTHTHADVLAMFDKAIELAEAL
jgi:hypothetical protein